jgi:hypothetical protein
LFGILLCCALPAAVALSFVEQDLHARGILNNKDLPPIVGNEQGTVRDYLLNAWHWDGAIFLLFVISIPSLALGIWLLARRMPVPSSSSRAS